MRSSERKPPHQEINLGRRSDINWRDIELEFRLGLLSVRELARKHGIADSNLRARAKREGWSREEGCAARAAAREAVVADTIEAAREIAAQIGAQQAQSYRAAVEQTVLTALEVTREHQLAARRGMNVNLALLRELELACINADLIEAEIARCRDDADARAALIERVLGLKGRIDAFDRWSASYQRLAAAEREAHEIGADQKPNTIDELLLRIRDERARSGAAQAR